MKVLVKNSTVNQRNKHNVEKCIIFCCRWQYGSIFIHLAVVASKICEIPRNTLKIWTYSSSRSSKVIDLCVNRKRIRNFLLVINSNFGRICYRFEMFKHLGRK